MILTIVFYAFTSMSTASPYLIDTTYTDTSGVNFRFHNINQVECYITNTGVVALGPGYMDGYFWPKGYGHAYLEGIGVLFGTVDPEIGDTIVSAGYNLYGKSEFRPGLIGQDPKSTITHIYMYPYRWPAPHDKFPMAPYKPVSHQDSWCVYNDSNPEYHDTRPIGIEVYQTGYAWTYALIQDMIYLIYEIRNVSGRALNRNYLGFYVSLDIGNGSGTGNDIISAIPGRWYHFAGGDSVLADDIGYGWQEADEPFWTPPVPAVIGFDLLQTPFDLVPGHDKDTDGIPDQYERDSAYYSHSVPRSQWDGDSDLIPDWRDASQNPQVGMSAFKRITLNYEPHRDPEYYLSLAGYNFNNGIYKPFDTLLPPPDWQRFIMSSGPFDLMPDSSAVVALGIMIATWDGIYETPDTALALADRWLQDAWDGLYFETGVSRLPPTVYDSIVFVVSPNPSNNRANAALTLHESQDVTVGLYDVCGRKVLDLYRGSLDRGVHNLRFAIREYPQGTYFLVMKTADRQYARSLVIIK